jgi:hypothetical protein
MVSDPQRIVTAVPAHLGIAHCNRTRSLRFLIDFIFLGAIMAISYTPELLVVIQVDVESKKVLSSI